MARKTDYTVTLKLDPSSSALVRRVGLSILKAHGPMVKAIEQRSFLKLEDASIGLYQAAARAFGDLASALIAETATQVGGRRARRSRKPRKARVRGR